MDKTIRVWLITGAVAAAVGMGVFAHVYMGGEPAEPAAGNAETASVERSEKVETEPVPTPDEQTDAEYEAFMAWLEEEAAKQEEAEAMVEEESETAAPVVETSSMAMPDMGGLFAGVGAGAAGADMPRWRAIWADLNLTPEEQSRLREGFGLLMARWMSMPPEQQAAERARLRDMRVRWEGMNDDERAGASQRMRDRFEEWRASGQVELPQLTLD